MKRTNTLNRREHERFRLPAMYTSVIAHRAEAGASNPTLASEDDLCGHAYDISEGGVRIELDDALPVGDSVQLNLDLPGIEHSVRSKAEVIWLNDEQDDPGPRRMALRFTEFDSPADWLRLVSYLGRGLQRVAA